MVSDDARRVLGGTRFSDVRFVAETGSTNDDVMALAREGAPEGIVVVAGRQSAGRGRLGRNGTTPAGGSLLASVLMRPPVEVMGLVTMATAVAAASAVEHVAGFTPGLKWPNDLVVAGDGPAADRKLAGILAEADWPAASTISAGWRAPRPGERGVVVVGVGLNIDWSGDPPDDLVDSAVAVSQVTGRAVDSSALLTALLVELDGLYRVMASTRDGADVLRRLRAGSATLGRRVRVDLGAESVEGDAVDVSDEGHLVVDTGAGFRSFAVGDVVHLDASS
ncbi:biotin--[acetyl-CoA-carboxylase] ligase [soil metagenome]